jgi:hypothetical protein
MRRALVGLLALVPLLLVAPARAADPVPFDVAAAAQALHTGQPIYRAPGAIAQLDPAVVLPELGSTGRVLLAPPLAPGAEDTYVDRLKPLADLARALDLDVLLVTGLDVQVIDGSSIVQSDLGEAREALAHRDVTEPLRFAARIVREPDYVDDVPALDPSVPAPAALADQVVAGLRASPRWVAPGVDADLGDGSRLPVLDPPVAVRVAALPVLRRGAPYPDLGPALARAFPGELVITLRGSWIEAVGPDPVRLESARNYLLGVGRAQLFQQAVPAGDLVRLLLQRYADLQSADPFAGRPRTASAAAEEDGGEDVLRKLLFALTVLGAGGALLWFGPPQRRGAPAPGPSFRSQRARVYADLARVAEPVARWRHEDPYVVRAVERHDTAVAWLERADATGDPAALRAAADAVAQADLELRRVGLA